MSKKPSENKDDGQAKSEHVTNDQQNEWVETVRSGSDSCAKIKDLGFKTSKHIKMYGERFEIVSDPFDEGAYIAVRATSGNDPGVRTIRLPIALLVGQADRFLERQGSTGESTRSLGALPDVPLATGAVTTPSRAVHNHLTSVSEKENHDDDN